MERDEGVDGGWPEGEGGVVKSGIDLGGGKGGRVVVDEAECCVYLEGSYVQRSQALGRGEVGADAGEVEEELGG